MKPYPKYKDSGVEWIGEIPLDWEMRKISHSFNVISSGSTPKADDKQYYKNGTINWINTGDLNDGLLKSCKKKINEKALDKFSTLKVYPKGALIIAMYGATIGKVSILDINACTNQACCVMYDSKVIDIQYIFFWFIANKQNIISLSVGGGQPNISQNLVKEIKISCPKIKEQLQIANFLDHKTHLIDTLIEKKKRLIDLLKEERTAVINEAVTKGLDPDVPMKDSGIEWLGEIPEHWGVVSAKHLEKNSPYLAQTGPFGAQLHASDYVEEGIPLILIKNVNRLRIDDSDIPKITQEKANQLSLYRLESGDIVFSRVGSIGRIALTTVREKGWLISGQMLRLRFKSKRLIPQFAVYAISSKSIQTYFNLKSVGTTRDSINTEILKGMLLMLPPTDEQNRIVDFIQKETTRIDTIKTKTTKEIELLQEYRTALISEVVTGKIDVRDWKAPEIAC